MKQFIVLAASLPIMLALIAQFSLNESNNLKLYMATSYIYAANESAKQDGYYRDDVVNNLKKKISTLYKCKESEVIVEQDTSSSNRKRRLSSDRYIYYKVSYPTGQRFVTFLVKDGGYGKYVFEGYLPSEYVGN